MAEKCSILSSVVHIVYSSFVFIYCCTLIYYLYAIALTKVTRNTALRRKRKDWVVRNQSSIRYPRGAALLLVSVT